ncbi:very-long-chain 3-oxoacyl-CoA reductase-like [Hyperolius riggenbachi]|uniref:very-long-chain 3-oxoacyl-CoA reductase-like n=1 Tax=Hyperolius riggenbachi TaxID=752182 RepID=UPI0035A3333E
MTAEEPCLLEKGFMFFGLLTAIYVLGKQTLSVLYGLRDHMLSGWWRTDLRQYGRWAVVTGATDGIGKAYARELAKRGLDIVLMSRTLEKLKKVATEIEQDFGRKTQIIQVDFTRDSHIYQKIKEELKELEIGILVNNVGMKISEASTVFLDAPNLDQMLNKTINCNIMSVLWMTRIVLPPMLQRKKGLIINISSGVGRRPCPKSVVYSSSKAFIDFFSQGLNAEYKSQGILVQSVMPLFVSTDMTFKLKTNVFVKTPEDYACEALNTVGFTSRTSGCLSHSLQTFAFDLIPNCIFYAVLNMKSLEKYADSIMEKYKKQKK